MNIQPIVDAARANPTAFYVEEDEFILHLPTGTVILINVLGDQLIGDKVRVQGMELLGTIGQLVRDELIDAEVLARYKAKYVGN